MCKSRDSSLDLRDTNLNNARVKNRVSGGTGRLKNRNKLHLWLKQTLMEEYPTEYKDSVL